MTSDAEAYKQLALSTLETLANTQEEVEKLKKSLEEKDGIIKLLGEAGAKLGEKAEKAEKKQGNLQGALEHMKMKVDAKQAAIDCVERVVKNMEMQLKEVKQEKMEITHQLSDVLHSLSQRDQEILELKKQNEEIKTLREDVENLKIEMKLQKLKFESDTDYLLNLSNHEVTYLENQVKELEAENQKLKESENKDGLEKYDLCDDSDEECSEILVEKLSDETVNDIINWFNHWNRTV